jgi:hypothetical protein
LREDFFDVVGYDPHFFPKKPKGKFDVVLMSYVINVIKDTRERGNTLDQAWEYVKRGGHLVVVSRSHKEIDREARKNGWRVCGHGYTTHTGTYQRGYSPKQLDRLINGIVFTGIEVRTTQYGMLYCGASYVIVTRR